MFARKQCPWGPETALKRPQHRTPLVCVVCVAPSSPTHTHTQVTRLEAAVTASQGGAGAARSLSELDDSIEMCELEKRNKEASREMTLKRQNRLKEEVRDACLYLRVVMT